MSARQTRNFGWGDELCRSVPGVVNGFEFPGGGLLIDDSTPVFAPGSRNTDPVTSHLAAEGQSKRIGPKHIAVLSALVDAGPLGMIDHDHLAVNGLEQDTAGKRRGELMEYGFVADSGRKARTPRGKLAQIWVATDAGAAFLKNSKGHAS